MIESNDPLNPVADPATPSASGVQASQMASNLVYAFGEIGYDFGTEARYDSFVQYQKGNEKDKKGQVNFKDPKQFVEYIKGNDGKNMHKVSRVIWTLNQNDIPIYALQPAGNFSEAAYKQILDYLEQQVSGEVERVSVPGHLSGGAVKLQSSQAVPVIIPELHGMSGWHVAKRAAEMAAEIGTKGAKGAKAETVKVTEGKIRTLLSRVFYELHNMGVAPADRALNFAATSSFQISSIFKEAGHDDHVLDKISVEPSGMSRPGSDCWVVKMTFFNPKARFEQARKVHQITVDVSDVIPVTVGEVRSWSVY